MHGGGAVAIAKAAKRAGVTLLAGTDFHAPADAPYPSLYQEIELLVSSGVLTPIEALAAATSNAARAMGLASSGSIAPGKDASLVVLRADPSKDIRAIREVVTVFKRGREVEGGLSGRRARRRAGDSTPSEAVEIVRQGREDRTRHIDRVLEESRARHAGRR